MSRTALSLLLATSLALAACSKPAENAQSYESKATNAAPRTAAASAGADVAAASAEAPAPRPTPANPPVNVTAPLLAYAHEYTLQAPAKAIRRLVSRHEAACAAAGPTVCQVTGAAVQEMGEPPARNPRPARDAGLAEGLP